MIFNRHNTPPGGVNRPCSQSRKVATGVFIRSAKACCDKPVLYRAARTKLCSAVVALPNPACISASPCRTSANAMPASASIACAIFSISTLHRLLNITGLDIGLIRFLVQRNQHNLTLTSQIKINHTDTAALTFSRYRPRAPSAPGITSPANGCSAIQVINPNRSSSDHILSACF